MRNKVFITGIAICLFLVTNLLSQENNVIKLPKPLMTGGRPFFEVVKDRKTVRDIVTKELSDQTISNLLWTAYGINRPEDDKRTAPSAHNKQEIDVYMATAKGLFKYDAEENSIIRITAEDIRGITGSQDFVKTAPVNLIYVADLSKMNGKDDNEKVQTASITVGCIVQNVYLFCSSEGLATVVRGWFDGEKLLPVMKLKPEQKIIITQTVGYPK